VGGNFPVDANDSIRCPILNKSVNQKAVVWIIKNTLYRINDPSITNNKYDINISGLLFFDKIEIIINRIGIYIRPSAFWLPIANNNRAETGFVNN
jgi:putative ubiquitin-RnfH superfamily antitoxin RatB of RatAB toxin-antitoxin module